MRRPAALALLAALALAPAFALAAAGDSAPAPNAAPDPAAAYRLARKDAAAAAARSAALDRAVQGARDEAAAFAARQQAAAAAIAGAEAELHAARLGLAIEQARVDRARRRLERERAPLAALAGGLVQLGRRPPLLALADNGSATDLVRLQALLDSTMPAIQRRTAGLRATLAATRQGAAAAEAARAEVARRRDSLARAETRFRDLERQALARAEGDAGLAFAAEDRVLASAEGVDRLASAARRSAEAMALGRKAAALGPAPLRPFAGEGRTPAAPAYRLPAAAAVTEGMGAVNDRGVRARGLTLATARGAPLIVPADGRIAFAGPFRAHDGVIIIDHGNGWLTMLVGARADGAVGDRVTLGAPLGRALGPIRLELSHDGRPVSAALISGSSNSLSNARKNG